MTNDQLPMTNYQRNTRRVVAMNGLRVKRRAGEKAFDIKVRTFEFGVRVVKLVGMLPRTVAGIEVGRQLVRAGTSVGSNTEEADGALSRKDFVNHIRIARKEARESRYWLRLIAAAGLLVDPEIDALVDEAGELVRILSGIVTSTTRGSTPE